mgnify:CR=1 FL=1
MTKSEFTAEFAEMLGIPPEDLRPEIELGTIEMWDSVAWLSSLVLIEERLGARVGWETVSRAQTFQDILAAVAAELEG